MTKTILTEPVYTRRVKAELVSFAEGRKKTVSDGREAPRFAALLLQKFGYGMWKMAEALDDRLLSQELIELTDQLVSDIDPKWQESAETRWLMVGVNYGT